MKGHVATAEIQIHAPPSRVWSALTDPEEIRQYMFGSEVETDWAPGSPIVWKGDYEGTSYEDHGKILEVEPESRLVMTHFSPLTGEEDVPENYHEVDYEIDKVDGGTRVRLAQDNNSSPEAADESGANWEKMLMGLKIVVERSTDGSVRA